MRRKRREPSSARRKAVCQSSGTEAVYMPVTISIENTPLVTGLMRPANMSMGIVDEFAAFVPVENGLTISSRSVMGVEIPTVSLDPVPTDNYFGFRRTTAKLDEAYRRFNEVKQLTAELAQTENSVYRLATGIKKAQKRANALKNIIIPRFEEQVKTITSALDEKDREEFSRLKVIKSFIDED